MNSERDLEIGKKHSETILLIFSLAIFLLNDFIFFFQFYSWVYYVADYFLKSLIVIGIFLTLKADPSNPPYLKVSKGRIFPALIWTVALILFGLIIDQWLWRILESFLPTRPGRYFPWIHNPIFNFIDLTIGIILVAFTEEYIFRYLLIKKLKAKLPFVTSVIAAAVIFGLAHWSYGYTAILIPLLWGLVSVISVQKTKSLIPAMIAHYAVDVVAFSGVLNGFFH